MLWNVAKCYEMLIYVLESSEMFNLKWKCWEMLWNVEQKMKFISLDYSGVEYIYLWFVFYKAISIKYIETYINSKHFLPSVLVTVENEYHEWQQRPCPGFLYK